MKLTVDREALNKFKKFRKKYPEATVRLSDFKEGSVIIKEVNFEKFLSAKLKQDIGVNNE